MKEKFRLPLPALVGLVAYYKLFAGLFDGTNVFDYALNGFTGAPAGTDIAPAYPGFSFNGTDDQIDFASGPSSVSTTVMWVNPDSTFAEDVFALNLVDALTITTGSFVTLGFAGGTLVVYVNAIVTAVASTEWQMVSITDTVAKDSSAGDMMFGVVTGNFAGRIGETMLFDRVLTPEEIKSIYEVTKWRYPNN